MSQIKQILEKAVHTLTKSSSSPRIDAELLLAKTLNVSRTYFYSHPEYVLTPLEQDLYQELLAKRITGTPVAYLLGTREFWSLPLHVTEATLIPRPETEQLVELTLSKLDPNCLAHILDLGTGSGAIALALASERPNWRLLACDKSQNALDTSQYNANALDINNIDFLCSDWFESIPKQLFHAIVSNPPYIAEHDPHLKQGDVRFEPVDALVSGQDGLDALFHLIKHSQDWLLPNGLLLLEHGFDQRHDVCELLKQFGYQHIECWQDYQGCDRISGGRKKAE